MYKIYTSLNASSNFVTQNCKYAEIIYLFLLIITTHSLSVRPAKGIDRYNLGKQYRETVTKISDIIQYKTGH